MPIWLHLTLTILFQIVGFFGGAAIFMLNRDLMEDSNIPHVVAFIAPIMILLADSKIHFSRPDSGAVP